MSDSETTQTSRFSRSLIARLVAVGLFLAVGTFAVINTVNRRAPKPEVVTAPNDAGTGENAAAKADGPATGNEAKEADEVHEVSNKPQFALGANQGSSTTKVSVTGGDLPSQLASDRTAGASTAGSKPPVMSMATMKPAETGGPATATMPPIVRSNPQETRSNVTTLSDGATDGPAKPLDGPNRLADSSPWNRELTGTPALNKPANQTPPLFGGAAVAKQDEQRPPIVNGSITVEPETKSPGADTAIPQSLRDGPPIVSGASAPRPTDTSRGVPPITPSRSAAPSQTVTPYDAPPADNSPLRPETEFNRGAAAPTDNLSAREPKSLAGDADKPVGLGTHGNPSISVGPPRMLPSPTATNATSTPPNRSGFPPPSAAADSKFPTAAPPNSNTLSNPAREFSSAGTDALGGPDYNSSSPSAPGRATAAARATPGDPGLQGPQNPSLRIQKIAPAEVQLGQAADFQIILQNLSATTATGIVVQDRVPEGATLVSSEPRAETLGDGILVWNIAKLDPNETTNINLKLRPDRPGNFGSVAHVTFSAEATATTRCTKPVLEVSVEGKSKSLIGDEVVLDITVQNTGDGPANNVYLQETVPAGLEFSSGLQEIEYDIGNLAPGQKRQVQLKLKAAKVGPVRNRVMALADGDLQAGDELELLVTAPDLKITGDGPSRKYLKREATYQFAVTNQGTAPATNVNLVAALPKGLQFVKANNFGQYDAKSHSVYWSMPDLAANLVGKIELVALPIEPGQQVVEFRVTADLEQRASLQQATLVDAIVEVTCEIDDVDDPIEIGRETTYNIRVVNQGSQPASQVRLAVDFPMGLEPVRAGGTLASQIQGQRVVFDAIPRLDATQDMVVSITAKGTQAGDHRVVVSLAADDRETPISKEESTRVYSDRD